MNLICPCVSSCRSSKIKHNQTFARKAELSIVWKLRKAREADVCQGQVAKRDEPTEAIEKACLTQPSHSLRTFCKNLVLCNLQNEAKCSQSLSQNTELYTCSERAFSLNND